MNTIAKLIVAIHTRVLDVREGDRGATATEYALLVAFIALVIVVGVTAFGSQLNDFLNSLGTKIGTVS